MLTKARAQCDRLIVGLNTDASVRRLKGPSRPVQDQTARARMLASLTSVEAVVLFDEDTPLELIKAVRPDILAKGGDYTLTTVVGADFVQSYGGRLVVGSTPASWREQPQMLHLMLGEKLSTREG